MKEVGMTKSMWVAAGLTFLMSAGVSAQAQCVGDCNGDGEVAINELITGVNISLGAAQLSACDSFDASGDDEVAINELITGVNNALAGSCPVTGPSCGDGTKDSGEECDDGNNFGGDSCSSNCTTETARQGTFDPTKTKAVVQTEAIPIVISVTGGQTFLTGTARDTVTQLATGEAYPAGFIPTVIREDGYDFDPVRVTGLVCACVRGVAADVFGPGVASTGSIACGDTPLTDVNYRLVQDHNTSPGNPENRAQGTPDDPECNDTRELPGGTMSEACVEGSGDLCSDEEDQHIGVCRGPRELTRFGGAAPRGSALLFNNTSISLLQDAGACSTAGPRPNGTCPYPDYGPDCQPCTADDLVFSPPENIPLTTGSSEAAVFDANNSSSASSGAVIIDKDQSCFGLACQTQNIGSVFDCEELENNPTGGLSGGSLAVTFPSIDAKTIGDNVTGTVFFNQ